MKYTTVEINENQTIADKKQIAGEVMERNKFYKALKEIRQIAEKMNAMYYCSIGDIEKIQIVCNKALNGIK